MSLRANRQAIAKFNRWAKSYDEGRLTTWMRQGQEKSLEALCLNKTDLLLDVGCGTGWGVMRAAERLFEGRACGVDLSPAMIAQARKTANELPNVEFQVADAELLPYDDAFFNAVMCTHSFHHYSDPVRALSEIYRVTKPGGRLVILDSNRDRCAWVWCWDHILRVFEKSHVRYYTEGELLGLFDRAGYSNRALVYSEHFHCRFGKLGWGVSIIRADKDDTKEIKQ
jgi:ubiquinone/menaquinone biosynthesis C-methylase UbiE